MFDNYETYIIVHLLSEPIKSHMERLIAEVSQMTSETYTYESEIPPHLTLHGRFPDPTGVVNFLKQFSKEYLCRGVQINLKGYGYFRKEVVYIDVPNTPWLQAFKERFTDELRRKLPQIPFGEFDGGNRKLHATIANKIQEANFLTVWEFVNKSYPNPFFTVPFDNLAILGLKDGKWRTMEVVEL